MNKLVGGRAQKQVVLRLPCGCFLPQSQQVNKAVATIIVQDIKSSDKDSKMAQQVKVLPHKSEELTVDSRSRQLMGESCLLTCTPRYVCTYHHTHTHISNFC